MVLSIVQPAAAAGGWSQPARLEQGGSGDAWPPRIAMDAGGNATAIWQYHNVTGPGPADFREEIHSNRFEPALGWRGTETRTNETSPPAFNPWVAHGDRGDVFAAWEEWDGTVYKLVASRRDPFLGWGSNVVLQTAIGSPLYRPRVAAGPQGVAHVVWQGWDGTHVRIFWALYSSQTGWNAPLAVDGDPGLDTFYPEIAVDHGGNAIVVWYEATGGPTNIRATRYRPGFDWDPPVLLETSDAGDAFNPVVGVDRSGNALAIWEQYDGTRWGIWAARYPVGDTWSNATELDDGSRNAQGASIAVGPEGTAFAMWTYDTGSRTIVQANRFNLGGWGGTRNISAGLAGSGGEPQVATDGAGIATVVWTQTNGTSTQVYASRSEPTDSWDLPTQLSGGGLSGQRPAIALDGRGNAVAAWHSAAPGQIVYASRYGLPSGSVPGMSLEFVVLLFLLAIAGGGVVVAIAWAMRKPKK